MRSENSYLLKNSEDSYDVRRNKANRLSFHELSYSVPQRRYVCFPSRPKPVLQSVSGIFRTGLNAILGPTGSGKTSLMDLLAARISHRRFSGEIRVNGQPQPDHFRFMAGYVVQQDFLEGVLSVRENIHFSASLRLSRRSLSEAGEGSVSQQRDRLVQEVIEKLGLSEVADCRVGTDFSRGVSGGERKRTHIATELVIAPAILFLDEPTSGLDAYTALKLMRQLKSLSEEGRLIVVTLHQPRYAILQLLERVTLLSAGETVYHGQWSDATGYFSELGYECEERENPGDYFLDLIVRESRCLNNGMKQEIDLTNIRSLASQFNSSHHNTSLYQQVGDIHRIKTYTSNHKAVRYPTSSIWQFLITLQRSSRVVGRAPITYLTHTMLATLGYMLFGFILLQSPLTPAGLHDRYGLFTMIILHHLFGLATGTRTIHAGKLQFIHEHQQGYYRTLPYMLGQLLPEFFPSKVVSSFVASTVLYFMFGFKLSVTSYLLYILSLQLLLYSGSSITLCAQCID